MNVVIQTANVLDAAVNASSRSGPTAPSLDHTRDMFMARSSRFPIATFRSVRARVAAFTLVETLVIIALIGVLVALLIPAVQAARESARRVQCQNNMKQMALATVAHEGAHGHFPTNGWGWRWVGDPDNGFDRRQPGGWVYNILPFIEEKALRRIGAGLTPDEKRAVNVKLVTTPIPIFNCPSRRSPGLYPAPTKLNNVIAVEKMAKSDYAVNGGDAKFDTGPGPNSLSPQDLKDYIWPDIKAFNGIGFVFSMVRMPDVSDGASKTYLLGEKYVASNDLADGSGGDDETMYLGDDADIRRWTMVPPLPDAARIASRNVFGSAHSNSSYFGLCDGSVRPVRYDVDPEVHRMFGNRRDALLDMPLR